MASSNSTSVPPGAAHPVATNALSATSSPRETGGARAAGAGALTQQLLNTQLSYVEELLAERRVLLLGLHRAPPLSYLAQCCGELVVVDPSSTRIRYWQSRSQGVMASWLVADLSDTGLAGSSFDAILTFDPLVPGEDAREVLAELRRLLHPDGFLLLSVPGPGRRVLEPLTSGPLPDLLEFRAQVKEHFPQVELLYQQTSLTVQVSTRPDALPTWQATHGDRDALVHSYVLLCSHLEIELETQALTRFSLKPVLDSIRVPARRQALRLDAVQAELEAQRTRPVPSLPPVLPEPTGPTVDLPSEGLNLSADPSIPLISRPVPRTTFTINAADSAGDSLIHPDEVTLHDPPSSGTREGSGRLHELQLELRRLQEENSDLRLELQESDGALNASERIRRDQADQLRSTTRLLEQQLEEHGRLQDLFGVLQSDHGQLQRRLEEIDSRLNAAEDFDDDALDESSQPIISEKSFPPMEITNDPIIEALAPSARSALRKQRIYFERQLTREQLKIWELEEKVQALEHRQVSGQSSSDKGEGNLGSTGEGSGLLGGKRPAWSRAPAAGASVSSDPVRAPANARFELGSIPGGLEAEIDHSVSIEIPTQATPRDAARARRPIGSPLAPASAGAASAGPVPVGTASVGASVGAASAGPVPVGAVSAGAASADQEHSAGAGALGPSAAGRFEGRAASPSVPPGVDTRLRTDDILRSVFDSDVQELEPLVPGEVRSVRSDIEKSSGAGAETRLPFDVRPGAARGAVEPVRTPEAKPGARGAERAMREPSVADGQRGHSSGPFNPPPVSGETLGAMFGATPQERPRAAVPVPEPLRAETVREAAPRETPFESGLELLPEVPAPAPPRRRQVEDPLAASFHFLDAEPSPSSGRDDGRDEDSSEEGLEALEGDRGLPPLPPIPRPPEDLQRALLDDWDALPSRPQTQGLAWNAPVVRGAARPAPLLEPSTQRVRPENQASARASVPDPVPSEDGTISFLLEEEQERPAQSRREARARIQARAEGMAASSVRAAVPAPVPSVAASSRGARASGASRPVDGAQALLEGLSQQSLRELPSVAKKASSERSARPRLEAVRSDDTGAVETSGRVPARVSSRPPVVIPESSTSLEESFFQGAEGGRIGKRQSGSENAGKRRGPASPVTLPSWSGPSGKGAASRPAPTTEAAEEVPQPLMQRFLTRFWK